MIPPNIPPAPKVSSFFRREMSKADVIIQFFRPQLNNRIGITLEGLNRLIVEAETITKLGIMIQPNGARYYLTPKDLMENLDEYGEILALAEKGREFLSALGYVAQRQVTPPVGAAPVGTTVDVVSLATQLPGQEPLQSVGVIPKEEGTNHES